MLSNLIPELANRRILVIGDLILDEYLTGRATRMSREAPIPVLEFEQRRHIPGGAANPAANIVALGSSAVQVGLIGQDIAADHLVAALKQRGIDSSRLVVDSHRPTTVKMRIMAQMGLRFPQQVARLDTLSREPISPPIAEHILRQVEHEIPQADALLFSDYHAGLLTPPLIRQIVSAASGRLLAADAQGELEKYAGFALVKCNADEASAYLGRTLRTDDDFALAATTLRQQFQIGWMFITRGAEGMTFVTHTDVVRHAPAPAVTDVYDTVGAGDTTVAVLTLAAAAGIDALHAAALANVASGLVVRRVGNYAPSPHELVEAIKEWGMEEEG